jgi:hypothetical protein
VIVTQRGTSRKKRSINEQFLASITGAAAINFQVFHTISATSAAFASVLAPLFLGSSGVHAT